MFTATSKLGFKFVIINELSDMLTLIPSPAPNVIIWFLKVVPGP